MQSGLRKDFPKLMFRALALHQSKTLLLVLVVGYSVIQYVRLTRAASLIEV